MYVRSYIGGAMIIMIHEKKQTKKRNLSMGIVYEIIMIIGLLGIVGTLIHIRWIVSWSWLTS